MPHFPKPWLRKGRGWYLEIGGRQVKLAPPDDKEEAYRVYHEIMARRGTPLEPLSELTLTDLATRFILSARATRKPSTVAEYRFYVRGFLAAAGEDKAAARVIPYDLTHWLDESGATRATRRNAITAVKRMFNWAVDQGLLQANPIARVKKPGPRRRKYVMKPAHSALLLEHESPEFRDLVAFTVATGCRVQEVRTIEAHHVQGAKVVLPPDEHKTGEQTEEARVIHLPPEARAIVERLAGVNPTGPLFRGSRGQPWTSQAIRCRFRNLRKKHPELAGACLMGARHAFATYARRQGVDLETLRRLMGHSSYDMLRRFYMHETDEDEGMQAALEKIKESRATSPKRGSRPKSVKGRERPPDGS